MVDDASDRDVVLKLTRTEARSLASLLGTIRAAFEGINVKGYAGQGPLSGLQSRLEEAMRAPPDDEG